MNVKEFAKMYMWWIIAVVALFITLLIYSYATPKALEYYKLIKSAQVFKEENEKLKKEIEVKDQLIQINEKEIEKISKNRDALAKKVAQKVAESKSLKSPADVDEIVQRLKMYGLNPQVKK